MIRLSHFQASSVRFCRCIISQFIEDELLNATSLHSVLVDVRVDKDNYFRMRGMLAAVNFSMTIDEFRIFLGIESIRLHVTVQHIRLTPV